MNFKQKFWNAFRWGLIIFLILFIFRFIYGYFDSDASNTLDYGSDFFSSLENLRKNYASEKYKEAGIVASPPKGNQKFEKTATIRSKSSKFDNDQADIRTKTKNSSGVIQYEQILGNKGKREIHMLIGVVPDQFDSLYAKLLKIGIVRSTDITKIDKTNEFRKLNAQQLSLEKTLTSLNELRSRNGQISDYVILHDKILQIEMQIQELGVELGNFDSENEFCTIRFTLYEREIEKKIGMYQRIKIALEWTIKFFCAFVFSLLGLAFLIYITLIILERYNVIRNLIAKFDQNT